MRRFQLVLALGVGLACVSPEASAQLINKFKERSKTSNAKEPAARPVAQPAVSSPTVAASLVAENSPAEAETPTDAGDPNKSNDLLRRNPFLTTATQPQQAKEPAKAPQSTKKQSDPNANVVASIPVISVETVGPAEINIGRRATFTISVRNQGEVSAYGVIVRAMLPTGAELIQTEPKAELNGQTLEYRIGDIAPRAERKLQIELIPRRHGALDLKTHATVSTSTVSAIQVRRPAVAVQVTGPSEAVYGDVVTFKAIITNTGDGLVEDVSIAQILPGPGGDGIEQTELVFEQVPARVLQLLPGQSQEIDLRSLARQTGPMRADIVVKAADGLESRAAAEVRVRRPEIAVRTVGPEARQMNRAAGYVILVSNAGDAAAENMVVTAVLPAGLEVVGIEKRTTYDKSLNSLVWKLSKIEPGTTESLKFQAKAVQEGEQTIEVSAIGERNLTADAAHNVVVTGKTDLILTLEDAPGPIEVGGQAEYQIRVKNCGSKTAQTLRVRCDLPRGLEVEEGPGFKVDRLAVEFTAIDQLPVGEEKVLRFTATGREPGDHMIRVTLRCNAIAQELTAETSTLFFKTGK